MNTFSQSGERDFSGATPMGARAGVVNRTHRVVREQALNMREQQSRRRSLWLPVGISSVLLLAICYAVWFALADYDLTPTGIPDASDQMVLLVLWLLPVTMAMVGLVWFKLGRGRIAHNGEAQQ